MEAVGLTFEMVVVLIILSLTVFLFVSEIVRVDFAAIIVMVLLGCLASVPGLDNIVDVRQLFDGFGSNAVISIIAVMIIGAGLDRTGVMSVVAAWISKAGGATEVRIIPMVSGTVGTISSFMQNVGAAALFLPVVSRIAVRTGLPMSRLLMPMGFCAILGGTMTMVGSSPLILLNDLIQGINGSLPNDRQMRTFSLFSVTPIGLALLATGILYFVFLGQLVLPRTASQNGTKGRSLLDYYHRTYGLKGEIHEVPIPVGHILVGKSIDDVEQQYGIQLVATHYLGKTFIAPPRTVEILAPVRLAVIGEPESVAYFLKDAGLHERPSHDAFAETLGPSEAGIAEVVISPNSSLIGKTGREIVIRRVYGISPLVIFRGGETLTRDREKIGRTPYKAGDLLVCHTTWDALTRLEKDRDFVVVTSDYPREQLRPQKVTWALAFFLVALGLILLTDLRLSLCLLVGASGMIASRVLSIEEAYEAVSWNTVFLLACLIPLGQAVQSTGTAEWIAAQILALLDGMPIWVLQAAIAVLATFFTLVMSNVGATVLLVPLAVNIALQAGADPALFALTVAISTSNSFLIPTHQVNALIMGPGGYSVSDFIRAGGIMTLLFLVVSLAGLSLLL
ncbi:MAG: SLC13 family permease [Pseudomonadota bacterium]